MLGQYVHVQHQAQQAISRLTGKACTCNYPLLYYQNGAVAGYALDAYVAGQQQEQTFYFDAHWQPLAVLPAGARLCCIR